MSSVIQSVICDSRGQRWLCYPSQPGFSVSLNLSPSGRTDVTYFEISRSDRPDSAIIRPLGDNG